VKLKSYDVRTGKMGLREVNDFRVGSILIDDAASFGVTTRQLLIEILKSIVRDFISCINFLYV
jgi:hypothetical protein